jgi:pimeloyl-ACP methyl ester carboxylesterase
MVLTQFPYRLRLSRMFSYPTTRATKCGLGLPLTIYRWLVNPASLPPWLTEADVDIYVDQFKRTGYRGGLNWYRNIERNWQLLAPFSGLKVTVPAILIAGDRDAVLAFRGIDQVISNLRNDVPKLQKTLFLPECGHWTQQEQRRDSQSSVDARRDSGGTH